MFQDAIFKKYKIEENNSTIGEFEVNVDLVKNSNFKRPFNRDNTRKTILKIGDRDYEKLNEYIIHSMKDYHNRLNDCALSDYEIMSKTYHRLYSMWLELHTYKNDNNLVAMDNVYDLFSYELYVLGYTEIE